MSEEAQGSWAVSDALSRDGRWFLEGFNGSQPATLACAGVAITLPWPPRSACAGVLYLFVSRTNTGTRPRAVLGL